MVARSSIKPDKACCVNHYLLNTCFFGTVFSKFFQGLGSRIN